MSADVPGWNEPEYPQRPPAHPAGDRVKAPAIFLLIVGIFNLLVGCVLLLTGFMVPQIPAEKFERDVREAWKQYTPEQKEALEKAGWGPENFQSNMAQSATVLGVVELVAALLIVFGAIRMLMLRSYGLAVVASLLAAVPIVSCCACPLPVGIGVAIWSLAVLFSSDVRTAFR
jgi:hypothetical protein